jgi:glyoxylase-like metal-dependent hydrolase (beta-lactamase superfamily II)
MRTMSPSDDVISIRRFGDAEVALISVGRLSGVDLGFPADRDWRSSADLDARGRLVAGLLTAVIRVADAVVLVDPAFFNSREEAAGYFDGEMFLTAEDAFARLELQPDDVTHVVVTHAHRDHYWGTLAQRGGVDVARFPNAEHLVPAADWELPWPGALLGHNSNGVFDGLQESDFVDRLHRFLDPVVRAGQLRLVEGDYELWPGVSLLRTAGETEGHQVVRVDGGASAFYYLGDLFHLPAECRDLDIAPARLGADQVAQLAAARKRILTDAVERDATLVFTHARFPGWGSVEPITSESWRWRWT